MARFRRVPLKFDLSCVRVRALDPQDGTWLPGTGAPQLIVNFGNGGKMRGRAVWFLRNADLGEIDLTKVGILSLPPLPLLAARASAAAVIVTACVCVCVTVTLSAVA